MLRTILLAAVLLATLAPPAQTADLAKSSDWSAALSYDYRVANDIVYSVVNGYEAKLDVYTPRSASKPNPTVIFIHGGGWTGGTKEGVVLQLLPYMRLGMTVVNVEYRLARISLAPAAVADCRCALRWVYANASEQGFDTSRLIVTGGSAGGHLALMTGILDWKANLDYECSHGPHDADRPVTAIVNFYGITDVNDLLTGVNQKSYAVRWLGTLPDRETVAKRVSPLTHIRAGLPPILTIHGDADPTVPYQHAKQLHKALDEKRVPNQLMTIPGGKHGGFTEDEAVKIHETIEAFLKKHKVLN